MEQVNTQNELQIPAEHHKKIKDNLNNYETCTSRHVYANLYGPQSELGKIITDNTLKTAEKRYEEQATKIINYTTSNMIKEYKAKVKRLQQIMTEESDTMLLNLKDAILTEQGKKVAEDKELEEVRAQIEKEEAEKASEDIEIIEPEQTGKEPELEQLEIPEPAATETPGPARIETTVQVRIETPQPAIDLTASNEITIEETPPPPRKSKTSQHTSKYLNANSEKTE